MNAKYLVLSVLCLISVTNSHGQYALGSPEQPDMNYYFYSSVLPSQMPGLTRDPNHPTWPGLYVNLVDKSTTEIISYSGDVMYSAHHAWSWLKEENYARWKNYLDTPGGCDLFLEEEMGYDKKDKEASLARLLEERLNALIKRSKESLQGEMDYFFKVADEKVVQGHPRYMEKAQTPNADMSVGCSAKGIKDGYATLYGPLYDCEFSVSCRATGHARADIYEEIKVAPTPSTLPTNPDNGGTVICTELHRQGLLEDRIYQADALYGQTRIDKETLANYQVWGAPVAKLMSQSPLLTKVVQPFATAWAHQMAYEMGVTQEENLLGKVMLKLGIPASNFFGGMLIN